MPTQPQQQQSVTKSAMDTTIAIHPGLPLKVLDAGVELIGNPDPSSPDPDPSTPKPVLLASVAFAWHMRSHELQMSVWLEQFSSHAKVQSSRLAKLWVLLPVRATRDGLGAEDETGIGEMSTDANLLSADGTCAADAANGPPCRLASPTTTAAMRKVVEENIGRTCGTECFLHGLGAGDVCCVLCVASCQC